MGNALNVRDLAFGYGRQVVLKNIRLSVRHGEFFIIIGPNGSGKTTLLKLMAGLLPAPHGTLMLGEKAVGEYTPRERARRLAYVPQAHFSEFPIRLFDFVLLGRAPHLGLLGKAGEDDRACADEALAFTDLAAKSDSLLHALSGGEGQRALIAKAVCQATPLMLLDEPTASLDLGHQVRVMTLLEKLRRERHCTVVMVSHDLNLAARYADRLLLLADGAVAALGAPEAVLVRDRLETVYQCRLQVTADAAGGRPFIRLA